MGMGFYVYIYIYIYTVKVEHPNRHTSIFRFTRDSSAQPLAESSLFERRALGAQGHHPIYRSRNTQSMAEVWNECNLYKVGQKELC